MNNKEIKKYDKNNNCIYWKNSNGFECWYKYNENNNIIYYRDIDDYEYWYKYNGENKPIEITEKEYKEIEFRKKKKNTTQEQNVQDLS